MTLRGRRGRRLDPTSPINLTEFLQNLEWFIQEKHKLIYISIQGQSGVHMVEEVGFRGGGRGIRSQQQIFLERSRS